MTKKLIIAEKPSVAADIAKALGSCTKEADYYENNDYVISSAVGHLLEIHAESYDVKRGKWSLNNLPVIPIEFELKPIVKTESRLKVLLRLLKRKDVSGVVNACDAGREGELIFKLIMQYAKSNKPIERLWLQSMTPQAIKQGFDALKSDTSMQGLTDAARCRSEADWLVGINGTRAMTAFNSKDGGFFLTTVGRVQTPTLSIVVEREEKRKKFVAKLYWEITATFMTHGKTYEGKWYDMHFTKAQHEHDRESRLFDYEKAHAIYTDCQKYKPSAQDETKPSQQNAPSLFDLTTLQRESNARFGLSAKNTLAVAQALYEKHKAITYPRTDSRYLPQDYIATVTQTLNALGQQDNYTALIKTALAGVKPNKRIFDNTKVSDHFAIIPTTQIPKNLSEIEQKIYDLITRRFIAIFYPAAEYLVTTRTTLLGDNAFKTEGKVLKILGWLTVYNRTQQEDSLCELYPNDLHLHTLEMIEQTTNPPPRYNEATLLSSMESAGKLIEDEELRQAMHNKGLGTPATRASIIEGLITEKYIVRDGKELIPTAKAFQLSNLLRGLGIHELVKPELTGEWEYKLSQIEQNKYSRQHFMQEIVSMTTHMVNLAKEYASDTVPGDYICIAKACPDCGSDIQENYRRFACVNCTFSFTKTPAGRQLEVEEVHDLLTKREIGPLQGFRSKQGRPFASILKLAKDGENENQPTKLQFDFGQNQNDDENISFEDKEYLGVCPNCASRVFDYGIKYVCEHALGKEKTCTFSVSKVILQQEINTSELLNILNLGRTSLLNAFKSTRTGRGFKAYLVFNQGKIGFEFEQKAASSKTKASTNKIAKTESKVTTQNTVQAAKTAKAAPKKNTKTNAKDTDTIGIKKVAKAKISKEKATSKPKITKAKATKVK
jgi:DNA topoisomerase III